MSRITNNALQALCVTVLVASPGCKEPPRQAARVGITPPPAASARATSAVDFRALAASIRAINDRDWTLAASIYAVDATWTAAGSEQVVVGRDVVTSIWRDLVGWFPDLTLRATRLVRLPRGYLVEGWVGGTAGPAVESLGFDVGAKLGLRSAEVLTVDQGLVTSVTAYGPAGDVRAQLSGQGTVVPPPYGAAAHVDGPGLTGQAAAAARAAVGGAEPDWVHGAADTAVVARGRGLWVIRLDRGGAVVSKRAYGGSE